MEILLANFRPRLKSKLDFFWRVIFKGFVCWCSRARLQLCQGGKRTKGEDKERRLQLSDWTRFSSGRHLIRKVSNLLKIQSAVQKLFIICLTCSDKTVSQARQLQETSCKMEQMESNRVLITAEWNKNKSVSFSRHNFYFTENTGGAVWDREVLPTGKHERDEGDADAEVVLTPGPLWGRQQGPRRYSQVSNEVQLTRWVMRLPYLEAGEVTYVPAAGSNPTHKS